MHVNVCCVKVVIVFEWAAPHTKKVHALFFIMQCSTSHSIALPCIIVCYNTGALVWYVEVSFKKKSTSLKHNSVYPALVFLNTPHSDMHPKTHLYFLAVLLLSSVHP